MPLFLTPLCFLRSQNQRIDALQRAAGAGVPVASDLPMSLKRRYEVVILPLESDSAKPRKLREIKAEGKPEDVLDHRRVWTH